MKNIQALGLIFISLMFSLDAFTETIVAEVNGVKITRKELMDYYNKSLLTVTYKKVTKEAALNDLMNRIIGIQKAKKEKLNENEIVKNKMEDVLYHAQISKDLEPLFKKIKVTDKDVEEYYKNNPEYRTAHILFRMRTTYSSDEMEAALKQALEVYHALEAKPDTFAQLANKYSQASNAPNGGDMGFQPAIQLPPEYYEAIKGRKVGYMSKPIKTQFGIHIIKILAVKSFDDIKKSSLGLYKKIVYDRKRDQIIEDYFSKLRSSASTKIYKKNF